ncbi:MAG: single-stranded-DNA-specific exonuclease RecJ [Deltaproteobacteria bacterium]|nr:single-stranded-DNA-specific exonuclease RecJ [Deltaproteobacteria bacterium]MBW2402972.1 single-stranded-DNA-specific exonuclease RecJ [Deltaproteobacteria bacterium]MBW2546981.1 single-stranded-DNA-specific exonuclease RecJ [Deltaproteobacteria bacterium]MBW2717987.1 single-stranded-DNA-specific exonuclease RecJ [Deltaproteobacteria bacterium]
MNRYRVRPSDERAAGMLADACGLGVTAAQVLLHRGLRDADAARSFLDSTLRGLSSPEPMLDRALASERIARAIRARERIVVFGDYDVDGTTSAVILSEVIAALGGEVRTLIADRFHGGYGLSDQGLDRCLAEGPGLLVTCDCGSSDHERIAKAMARGIDVIVVDHHLVPEQALPAFAFLNPHRPDCGFAYKGLCSAGLAFSLGAALRSELGAELDLRGWLDLVAIGTIADLAPLTGDNRRLVRAGLKNIGVPSTRPALVALRQAAKIPESAQLTARDVAFRFSPRLNAPGRLGVADLTLRFLTARTPKEAWGLLQEVEAKNEERKMLANHATEEARAQVRELYGEAPEEGVVVASDTWHRGVVGIVAARLVDTFGVPAVVIAFDAEHGHGSARTTADFDVYSALSECASDLSAWGGHRAAAGISLSRKALDSFRASFLQATQGAGSGKGQLGEVDVALGGAFRVPTVEDLQRLGPFGEGYPTPTFLVDAHVVEATGVGEGRAHGKLKLRVGQESIRAFAPAMFSRIEGRDALRLVGEFQPDHWIGGHAIELLVTDVLD